jgi:hypothetical protein
VGLITIFYSLRFETPPTWQVKVKVTLRLTVSQSVSLGVEPHLGSLPDIYYSLTVTVLFWWGALSDERTGLSFEYAAGPRQHSHSRVRVPWESWPYFTVSDLRLPFSSPPTTRRVTVEVFDHASTRVPKPGGPGPRIYIPQEQGCPVIPRGTKSPFRRLRRLPGLQQVLII